MDEKDLDDAMVEDALDDEEPSKPAAPLPPEKPGFLGTMWAWQHALDRKLEGIGRGRFARVLRMARKPEPDEYRQSAIIVLVGIAVIGGIGFFIFLFMSALLQWVDFNVKGV